MNRKHSSTIVPAANVTVDSRRLLVSERGAVSPKVTLHRDGQVIQQIEIQCACGKCIVLDCEYEIS